MEALARQRFADWDSRFGSGGVGLKVSLLTVSMWFHQRNNLQLLPLESEATADFSI